MVIIEKNIKDDEPSIQYLNNSTYIFNLLQDTRRSKIIIDVRSKEDYDKLHIRTAVNVPPPSPFGISEKDKEGNIWIKNFDIATYIASIPKVKLWNVLFQKVVVYSDREFKDYTNDFVNKKEEEINGKKTSYEVSFKLSDWEDVVLQYFLTQRKKSKVTVFQNGIVSFESNYPFVCNPSDVVIAEPMYASEIIENFLYLGGQSNAEIRKQIKNLKITHIVNMASELEDSYPHIYKYYRADLDDTPRADIHQHFVPIINFINLAKQDGGRVLVHCAMGISRSASAVIAYLIKENQMSYQNAFVYVKSKRSFINPNFGFVSQLKDFEFFLKNEKKPKSESESATQTLDSLVTDISIQLNVNK
ncbi:hypothetical protein DICPUDRAFT_96910 [Dictyostelium purpureum]|uniref:Protein-serine/threonine phosphatase n=1 Tax=Dictyostelium purpureum TaxID=5786 RepID=F0ZC70_DICPU|nr:uncharacterized protein DICPUDRAFT_96910 [Dictyostelium purpureum]EGC38446.1 hypothetical protein DICPUDRAFT_96910 [Dictyostelium purpureum]|eukprot:XP_003285004.1 hypothetical protein DICPUDRAFT_96910 [Dictyostelium purpureum]